MDSITIEIAKPDQKEAIRTFLLEYFREDEPISRAVKMSKDEASVFFDDLVSDGLAKPVSFVALNNNNQVIGCRLNEIVDLHSPDHHQNHSDQYSNTAMKIVNFLEMLMKDIEKLLPPDTKRVMKFLAVSVHPDYQRRGIAKELIERSMNLAIEKGCDYVCTGATAMRSQQLFEKKLNFETLRVIDYSDYRDSVTDEQIFNCDDGTNCGKLMAKKLR